MGRRRHRQFPRIDRVARDAALRVGLKARRSRFRLGSQTNLGGFALLDATTNVLVAGERFELTPADVVRFCEARQRDLEQP